MSRNENRYKQNLGTKHQNCKQKGAATTDGVHYSLVFMFPFWFPGFASQVLVYLFGLMFITATVRLHDGLTAFGLFAFWISFCS